MIYPDVPHIQWPVRLEGARLATVEQDSLEDVAQCVALVLSTTPGTRLELPEFGRPDPTFSEGGADPTALEDAVNEWEPRAALQFDPELDERLLAQGQDKLRVRVRLAEEEV
jgi:hypothetical protein